MPRVLYQDATPEALAFGLAQRWPTAWLMSAEAGAVLGAHGINRESAMRNLSLLNVLWDGGTLQVERRTSESFSVKGARLTTGLAIQKTTLRDFLRQTGELARGTGFLARLLPAWPKSTQGTRVFTEAPVHWPNLSIFHQRMSEILQLPLPTGEDGSLQPETLKLSPAAKRLWIAYHDAIEAELKSCGELYDVRDVAAKSADNAARLAGCFHLFENGASGEISAQTFEQASRIAAWHLHETRRFFLGSLPYR